MDIHSLLDTMVVPCTMLCCKISILSGPQHSLTASAQMPCWLPQQHLWYTPLAFIALNNKNYFYLLVWCVVISIIWTAVVKLGTVFISSPMMQITKHLYLRSIPVRFDMAFLVIGCSVIMSMLWYDLEEKKARSFTQVRCRKTCTRC